MQNSRMSTLLKNSYTQSDFAYKIGLIKEFLEFGFFTEHLESIQASVIDSFRKKGTRSEEDIAFLGSLPEDFFTSCNKDNFHDVLNGLAEEAKEAPLFPITIPAKLSAPHFARIGGWVRNEINPNTMLKIKIDPSLSVGCRFVWNDQLHDFSLSYYFKKEKKRLHERLLSPSSQEGNQE